MTPTQAKQLLEGYLALLENENLQDYEGYPRQEYFDFIALLLGTDNRNEITAKLNEIIEGKLQAPSLPPELDVLLEDWAQVKEQNKEIKARAAAKVETFIAQQKNLVPKMTLTQAVRERPLIKPTEEPVEAVLKRVDLSLDDKIQSRLSEYDSILAEDPIQNTSTSNQIKDVLIALALQPTGEEKEKALPIAVEEVLRNNGIRLSSEQKIELFQNLINDTKPEIASLQKIAGEPLPEAVLASYAQKTEPVAITPLYALLHPQVALANLEKTALAPLVTFLNQGEPENLTQEQKESLAETRKGVTPEMIDRTIENLKASGLPEDHPTIKKLKAHREKLDRFQTNEEGNKKPITRIYETYHKAANITNGSKVVDKQTGVVFSNKAVWDTRQSYSFKLKEFINNAGQRTGLVQKINVLPGKIGFKFNASPRSLATSIYRNTAGRVVSGIKGSLAKSTVGVSVKKAAGWAIGKLGVKAGISAAATAIGTAIGGPIGAFVGKVVGFLAEKLLQPLISKISRALKDPNSAIAIIGGSLGVAYFVPALATAGIAVAVVVAAASAPALATAAASGVAGFLSALAGMAVSVAVTALTIGVLTALTIMTVFVVVVSSGAFVLPVNPLQIHGGGTTGPRVLSPVPPLPSNWRHLAERVVYELQNCQISYVNSSTWTQVETCLTNSGIPNVQPMIDQFHNSIQPSVDSCECLQCVGFVRGVMATLGKDPGGGRHARGYLDPPTPAGYMPINKTMADVAAGDLVVDMGITYGHIAIVVAREGNEMIVAQAWGGSGLVNMTKVHYSMFTGFLRPL
jgi:hypothetical protein